MRVVVELGVELIAGAARAVAARIAALNHEARLDAMEREAVVKAGTREFDERRRMLRRVLGIEFEDDVALCPSRCVRARSRLPSQAR